MPIRCRDCCRREVYTLVAAIILWCILIAAIASPWYALAATNLPKPWDSMTAYFWWNGMEGLYSPALVGNERTHNIAWSEMVTSMPKDVYMGAIALSFLALFFDTALMFIIFFGQICKNTTRILNMMFCHMFKWIVVLVCFIIVVLCNLSWIIFFAFPSALNDAKLCPGTTAYPVNPFPLGNSTCIEKLWCDSFANSRLNAADTNWVWAPSVGWIFALIGSAFAFFIIAVQLTVPTGQNHYEDIGDGPSRNRRDREREWSRDRYDRYDRSDRERSYDRGDSRERRSDDVKMQKQYARFDV
eukprot:TRINITY_DN1545_c0_g1_i1.p1 TRINITY_DN1545_c0_g1~~TRINITY_DN1545_c0_g1_i1.p1  ORF type:complete len:300 (-),score=31.43 TRINITY_DN1545_c0_g1_i1:199-1098(-)